MRKSLLYDDLIYIKIYDDKSAIAKVPKSLINDIIYSKKLYKYNNAPIDKILKRLHRDFNFYNNGNPQFYTITKDYDFIYYNFKRI